MLSTQPRDPQNTPSSHRLFTFIRALTLPACILAPLVAYPFRLADHPHPREGQARALSSERLLAQPPLSLPFSRYGFVSSVAGATDRKVAAAVVISEKGWPIAGMGLVPQTQD
jgi:hypothetical protein